MNKKVTTSLSSWKKIFFTSPKDRRSKKGWNRPFFCHFLKVLPYRAFMNRRIWKAESFVRFGYKKFSDFFFHDILLQISIIHSFKKVVIFFKFTPFWKNGCRFLITKTNIFFTTNLDVTDVEKNISTDCFLINCVKISLISLYYLF